MFVKTRIMHDASDFLLSHVSAKDAWDGTMFTSLGAGPSLRTYVT